MNWDLVIRIGAVSVGLLMLVAPSLMKSVKLPKIFGSREPDDAQTIFEILKRKQKSGDRATAELCKKLLDALLPNGT